MSHQHQHPAQTETTREVVAANVQGPASVVVERQEPVPPGYLGLAATMARLPTLKAVALSLTFVFCAVVWEQQGRLVDLVAQQVAVAEKARTAKVHETALSDAVVQSAQYAAVLKSVRTDLVAGRVVMWQFHNSVESLRGVPFLFASASAESAAMGVSVEQANMQRVPLSNIMAILPDFLEHRCAFKAVADADPHLRADMESHGTEAFVACPVYTDPTREPIGFLAAAWTHGWATPADIDRAEGRLRDAASAVGGTLGAYLTKIDGKS